jgi:hypothetical protein
VKTQTRESYSDEGELRNVSKEPKYDTTMVEINEKIKGQRKLEKTITKTNINVRRRTRKE